MAETHLYLTELSGLVVYDLKGRRLGKIRDASLAPKVDPVRVDRFLVGGEFAWWSIRHDQVASISLDGIRLHDEQVTPYHSDENLFRLRRDLLDHQIIDGHGRKVVRVTDLTFEIVDGRELWVFDVDIGLRSVFRRLAEGLLPLRWVRRLQEPIPVHSIPWNQTNIVEADPQRRLQFDFGNAVLDRMHPADLADIVEELGPDDREALFESMDAEKAAETLMEIDPEIQAQILESLETERAAEILEEMDPAEAAAALAEMEEETSAEILDEMDEAPAEEVQEILNLPDHTAGSLMVTEYLAVPESATVGDAFAAMRGAEEQLEAIPVLYLTGESGVLTGEVPLARLFLAPAEAPLREFADTQGMRAPIDLPEAKVAEMFDKYNLLQLAVVDENGVLEGVITATDVITLLRER